MNKQGAEEKLRQAGVLLFHNLFELEPRLRQLFPFKTGAGHIEDKVCHAIRGCPWVPSAERQLTAVLESSLSVLAAAFLNNPLGRVG